MKGYSDCTIMVGLSQNRQILFVDILKYRRDDCRPEVIL